MYKLKEVPREQDIYIVGQSVDFRKEQSFAITDDYHSFLLRLPDKKLYLDTDGYCNIMNASQFKKFIKGEGANLEFEDEMIYVVKGFVGNINLYVEGTDGKRISNKKYNLRNYIMYQIEDEIEDIVVTFDGTYASSRYITEEDFK